MNELFIVEGRSAADAIKRGLTSGCQHVLAMQGKPPNVKRLNRERILANQQCARLFSELGAGIEPKCNIALLRFEKVVMLMDADIDGVHSLSLLIEIFRKYLTSLVVANRVSILRPPLFRFQGKHLGDLRYAYSEAEKNHIASEYTIAYEITRYRGIAQLSVQETIHLLNKLTRTQLTV